MAAQLEQVKWVPGTRFLVDGFRFPSPECKHYFLTHAHADHTTGLNKSFSAGTIYCTPVTARLIIEESSIPSAKIHAVNLDESIWVEGVRITALCANHCPGACMFLFQVPTEDEACPLEGRKFVSILHTGDFRCENVPFSGVLLALIYRSIKTSVATP
jgi:Cft2 family RNA processing exonuclease